MTSKGYKMSKNDLVWTLLLLALFILSIIAGLKMVGEI